jgi:hypothetical protein
MCERWLTMGKITKREMIYIFIITQLIIFMALGGVALIYMKVTDSTTLINQVSLISGVTSIILALIAIVYAFFQSYDSSKQNTLVNETLIRVSTKVDELISLKTDMASMKSDITSQLAEVAAGLEETKASVDEEEEIPEVNKKEINEKISGIQEYIKDISISSNNKTTHLNRTLRYPFTIVFNINNKNELTKEGFLNQMKDVFLKIQDDLRYPIIKLSYSKIQYTNKNAILMIIVTTDKPRMTMEDVLQEKLQQYLPKDIEVVGLFRN